MKRIFLLTLLCIPLCCTAFELRNPLDIPIELSANFAELRGNHFHSGLDFKTQQQIGQPVYAVYDGYVSRINIASNGYGNCLYINHPEIGLTTVYAHLDSFEPYIDSVLKAHQYAVEKFEVDLYLDSTKIPVKKGKRVATSGNSGSSGGPHLHFETRDLKTEAVIDPQTYYYVIDDVKPRFHRIYITPIAGEGVVAGGALTKSYSLEQLKGNPVKAYGRVGIGVRANDYMTNTGNIYGVNSLKVEVDGQVKFHYKNDRFSFDSTRYINSFIDYAIWSESRVMVMKTYMPENACTEFIKEQTDGGYLLINENRDYNIRITIADFRGNTSVTNFTIRGDSTVIPVVSAYNGGRYFIWNLPNTIVDGKFRFEVPKGSLYNSIYFKYNAAKDSTGYSDIHQLHYSTEPLQKYANITIPIKNDTISNKRQYYMAYSADGTKWSYSGWGEYHDGLISGQTRALGYYKVMVDKTQPSIKFLGRAGNTICFKISDTGSGVGEMRGEIDGKWALFSYDAKKHTVSYTFDPARVEKGKNHKVSFTLYDNCGNARTFKTNVYW